MEAIHPELGKQADANVYRQDFEDFNQLAQGGVDDLIDFGDFANLLPVNPGFCLLKIYNA